MSEPPPADLMKWPKRNLAREVTRLRAILHEHSERRGGDPREASTPDPIIDLAGDPYAEGGVLLDARSAVLLDGVEVSLVDAKTDEDPLVMMLALSGRVNYSEERVTHAYLFGPDGAAGIVDEVVALATRAAKMSRGHGRRFAKEFQSAYRRRAGT